jgi:hypothetical protein
MAPPPIGYTADQRPRAARGAARPTVRSRGRWYKDALVVELRGRAERAEAEAARFAAELAEARKPWLVRVLGGLRRS